MLRPSGEICGSLTHCRSNTSSGCKTGFAVCAMPGASNVNKDNAAAPICSRASSRSDFRSFMPIPFACHPAVTLMLVDDSHGLHEGVANRRPDETKAALFEILAHRIAVCGGWCNIAQVQRPSTQHAAVRELPDVVVEGAQG